jgi:hypothetical protein
MTLFCLLWTPLFYLFWRSLTDESSLQGGAWALVFGALVAFFRFFLGSFINPGGFGLSRWISALIDIVALPAALPFMVCLIFAILRIIPPRANFTHLMFLWLIPVAALRALGWSSQKDPLLLVGVPVLWTIIVVGMGFFVRIIQNGWGWVVIPCILAAAVMPFLATAVYWAFFAQNTLLGLALLALALVPTAASLIHSVVRRGAAD